MYKHTKRPHINIAIHPDVEPVKKPKTKKQLPQLFAIFCVLSKFWENIRYQATAFKSKFYKYAFDYSDFTWNLSELYFFHSLSTAA